MQLHPDEARTLSWAFREFCILSVNQSNEHSKSNGVTDLGEQLISVQADVTKLQRKLFNRVENLSDREVKLVRFVYQYLIAYHPRYRIPSEHTNCPEKQRQRRKLFEVVLSR